MNGKDDYWGLPLPHIHTHHHEGPPEGPGTHCTGCDDPGRAPPGPLDFSTYINGCRNCSCPPEKAGDGELVARNFLRVVCISLEPRIWNFWQLRSSNSVFSPTWDSENILGPCWRAGKLCAALEGNLAIHPPRETAKFLEFFRKPVDLSQPASVTPLRHTEMQEHRPGLSRLQRIRRWAARH